jgi:hypothetical protein
MRPRRCLRRRGRDYLLSEDLQITRAEPPICIDGVSFISVGCRGQIRLFWRMMAVVWGYPAAIKMLHALAGQLLASHPGSDITESGAGPFAPGAGETWGDESKCNLVSFRAGQDLSS